MQLETDEDARAGVVVPAPPPPCLDRDISVPSFVGGSEDHLDPADYAAVVRYLSLAWIDALSKEVANSADLASLASSHDIRVTQVVTDGPEGDVTYHLQLGDGAASFGAGPADREDVRMQQSWATATAVATGDLNAQEAFIKGLIRLTGNQQKLIDSQPVFAALDAVFTSVREQTEYR